MALAKVNLGFPVVISAGTTATVVQVAAGRTTYVRSVLIYNNSAAPTVGVAASTLSAVAQIYMVPNSGGVVGTATAAHRIVRVALTPDDTYLYDLQYPLTLSNTGDSIQVFNEGTFAYTLSGIATYTNSINVMVLGDREG